MRIGQLGTRNFSSIFSVGLTAQVRVARIAIVIPPTSGITAPLLTKQSPTGYNPLAFTIYVDNTVATGMYWHIQVATDAGFTSIIREEAPPVRPILLTDFNGNAPFDSLVNMPAGQTYIRIRVVREDAVASAWSNVISDFLVHKNRVLSEGDSISAVATTGYNALFDTAYPAIDYYVTSVGGSSLLGGAPSLAARKASDLALSPEVVTFLIGSNDLSNTTLYPATQDFIDALFAHADSFRAIGSKVVLCTVLPVNGNSVHNTRRVTVNTAIKASIGVHCDQVADFDSTIMGVDATFANTSYTGDGTHPTTLGHSILYPNFKGAVNYCLAVANEVTTFAFTDVGGITAGATTTAAEVITISGLAYGESKPYSVVGGEVRKNGGSWGTSAGTVTNGDTLEVRGVANGTALGTTDVVLTVGAVSDTFTIATIGSGLNTLYRSSGQQNGGFASSVTFTSVPFYAGKNIVITMSSQCDQGTATLGGTTGTKVAERIDGFKVITYWEFVKGSGGSGNLVLGSPTISTFASIGYALYSTDASATLVTSVYLAYGYHPDDNLPDPNTNDTPSISYPSGGSIIWGGQSESASATWTGVRGTTIDTQFSESTNWKFAAGHRTTGGPVGINGASYNGSGLLAVSYQP